MIDLITKSFANILTLTNLVFGSLAIISAHNQDFQRAAIFIICAVVMDAMDGKIARKLGSTSELGKELDSLCDLVSFGVAPAILLYSQISGSGYQVIGLLVALLFIISGALRLARFNVLNISDYFVGVPITVAGFALAITSLFFKTPSPFLVIVFMLVLSFLMISNFRIPKI